MALGALPLVRLQPAQGLDGSDRCGNRLRSDPDDYLVLLSLILRLRFQYRIRSLLCWPWSWQFRAVG